MGIVNDVRDDGLGGLSHHDAPGLAAVTRGASYSRISTMKRSESSRAQQYA